MTDRAGPLTEFRRGWSVVLGSMLGVGLGVAALPFYTAGVFMVPLSTAMGWSRTDLSLGLSFSNIALALAGPMVGRLADRYGSRPVALASMAGFAAGYLGLTQLRGEAWVYLAAMIGLALLGAGTSPVTFTRAVNAVFDRSRGLALGITLLGTGLSAAVAPSAVERLIARGGWQTGFLGLGLAVAVGVPLVGLLLGLAPRAAADRPRAGPATGTARRGALRSRPFRILAVAFSLVTMAVAGLIVHSVPMLTDAGIGSAAAARIAGSLGVAVILGRVIGGFLVDRIHAAAVTVGIFGLTAAGCALIAVGGPALGSAAGPLLGFSLGAEIDLVAFFTARYFGLAAYGEIYGFLYGVLTVGAAVSPLLVGAMFDRSGSYQPALWTSAACLAAACLVITRIGPYPTLARQSEEPAQ